MSTGNDHGGGDTLAAAVACALAHGFTVPDAVAFGKRWVTECLRAAYPLGPVMARSRHCFGCHEPRPDFGHRT
ncbi:phosphomethylpyrimidine kinase family protein [Mycobacterium kansasii]|uniref:Phosphomethylpyrimidine kinase family protein n=1 Tax=Mycobacterium kansasii TaxID=1768 RepID=A0A1V3WPQ4_MYCKA|nr:phosphomethylpyrimidine kinase family protein [Mycobacterium kansasii]